ncbi:MAG TPA: hypothetical protein VI911_12050 [Patescibacteria group bacterium]|nr:hypothetical protein [Patescibacteria group bacterium]
MIEWLTNLWNKNRVLFYVFLPLVAFGFIVKLVLDYNSGKATDTINNTQQTDNTLAQQQASATGAASVHQENAQGIQNQINSSNNSEGDVNWHKK